MPPRLLAGLAGLAAATLASTLVACSDDEGAAVSGECAPYLDDDVQPVVFRVVNDRSSTLFLAGPGCSEHPIDFYLVDPSGEYVDFPRGEVRTCEEMQTEGGRPIGIACKQNQVYVLEPGESVDVRWAGAVMEDASMPETCLPEPQDLGGTIACPIFREPEDGTWTFYATSYDGCEAGGAPCACDQSPCQLPPGASFGTYGEVQSTFELPSSATVVVSLR